MQIKFNRQEITFINNLQKLNSTDMKNTQYNKRVAIPNEESFEYVLNKARSGNEMAAIQIDEWSRFCKPVNSEESGVLNQIKKSARDIFE